MHHLNALLLPHSIDLGFGGPFRVNPICSSFLVDPLAMPRSIGEADLLRRSSQSRHQVSTFLWPRPHQSVLLILVRVLLLLLKYYRMYFVKINSIETNVSLYIIRPHHSI